MSTHSHTTIRNPTGGWSPTRSTDRGRRFVLAVTLLAGLFMTAAGLAGLLAPDWFADTASFPRHTHFVHDAGAFQLGIGITLLLAPFWHDGLALALAGFLVANTTHAVNHAIDLDLGGHGSDPWGLAALSLLTAAALAVRLGQLGWVVGEVTTATIPALARFPRQKTVLVTTYRQDGRPVGTPVSLAVDGDHADLRSFEQAGKTRRLHHTVLRSLLADDIVWHVPGHSPIAGHYHGHQEVLGYFAARRAHAKVTFRVHSRAILADDKRAVQLADGQLERDGQLRTWQTVGVFRIADGKIAECWLVPFDQYLFDELWS